MALLKAIFLVTFFIEISLSVSVDKENTSNDLPTFFINANLKVNISENLKLIDQNN